MTPVSPSPAQAHVLVVGPRKPGRDDALDGLRGIAIALVLWHHLFAGYLPTDPASWLGRFRARTDLAWCGVDLFFVLSGFFIGGILIDNRQSRRLARVFYLRRALRILPLYYLTLATLLYLVALGASHAYQSFSDGIYVSFLTNFALATQHTWDWAPLSALWSLAVEEQFYLSAPWVIRAISYRRLPGLLLILVSGALVARIAILRLFPDQTLAIHVLMPFRMDCLALGFLLAWATRAPQADAFLAHLTRTWKFYLSASLLTLGILFKLRPAQGSPTLAFGGYTLLALAFAIVVAIVATVRPPALNLWLTMTPLIRLGRLSYFIYLWHSVIAFYLIRFVAGDGFVLDSFGGLALVLATLILISSAAAISWRFFERPLIRWGHRWSYD